MGDIEYASHGSHHYTLSLMPFGFLRRLFFRGPISNYQFKPTYELSIFPRTDSNVKITSALQTRVTNPFAVFHYANRDIALSRMQCMTDLLNRHGFESIIELTTDMRSEPFLQEVLEKTDPTKSVVWRPPYDPKLEILVFFDMNADLRGTKEGKKFIELSEKYFK
jgi:hypothetical protein